MFTYSRPYTYFYNYSTSFTYLLSVGFAHFIIRTACP